MERTGELLFRNGDSDGKANGKRDAKGLQGYVGSSVNFLVVSREGRNASPQKPPICSLLLYFHFLFDFYVTYKQSASYLGHLAMLGPALWNSTGSCRGCCGHGEGILQGLWEEAFKMMRLDDLCKRNQLAE